MREVPLPPPDAPPLQRSVVAAIAAILELDDPGEVPLPGADHPAPWTVWRNWLAGRGLGLVPVHSPATFNWPGPWIALLPAGDGAGEVAAVAFGSPPGLAWNPLPGTHAFDSVRSRLRHRARRPGAVGAAPDRRAPRHRPRRAARARRRRRGPDDRRAAGHRPRRPRPGGRSLLRRARHVLRSPRDRQRPHAHRGRGARAARAARRLPSRRRTPAATSSRAASTSTRSSGSASRSAPSSASAGACVSRAPICSV